MVWANDRVSLYREKFSKAGVAPSEIQHIEDLRRLPVTEREELLEDTESLLARGISLSRCTQRITSGSTGIPVTRAFTTREIAIRAALSRRMLLIYKLHPKLRTLVVGDPRPWHPSWHQRLGIYREKHLSAFVPQGDQARVYRAHGPEILSGYPSSLRLLGETIRQDGVPFPTPHIILTVGEVLLPTTRSFLQKVFQAPVRDRYGIEEMGYIAWECPIGGGYHLAADCGIFEVLEGDRPVAPGDEGDLVLTSLYARAMPLIRYRLGDRVAVDPDPCPCGCSFARIKRIIGRVDDLLQLPTGEWVHPVVAACGVVDIPGMERFRIIQKGVSDFQVDLVTRNPISDEVRYKIQNHFRAYLGTDKITINRVMEIRPDPSGKFRHIIFQPQKRATNDFQGEAG